MTSKMHEKVGRFHGFMMHLDLAILTMATLPFLLIIEKFYPKQSRHQLWRRVATWIIRSMFSLNGVTFKIKNSHNIKKDKPVIYASNHPSNMDGFMLIAILGADTVLFTAPLGQFPSVLRPWLRKMQAVDVRRDIIDDKNFPDAHSKKQAIRLAMRHLTDGNSLIVFPEGHTELQHVLHYFHTGVARIAMGSHTPIVPVSIINADRVFPDGHRVYPSSVLVNFGTEITPPKTIKQKTSFPKTQVLKLRKELENRIVENLPTREIPVEYKHKSKKVGVFIDIDRTLYAGLSQKDLITWLLMLHKIKSEEAFRIFYWLFLEKTHQMGHQELMRKSLLTLKGWDVAELDSYVHKLFKEKMIKRFQYGLYPILKDHAEQNHTIVLVSEVIHPLAQEFKKLIKARTSLDTFLETNHHCYTGETSCLCYKNEKARLVDEFAQKNNIDLSRSFAYADSYSDLPFLSKVKNPTAVNPDDKLLDFAVDHDWSVILDAS